jgi:hypothetical protein
MNLGRYSDFFKEATGHRPFGSGLPVAIMDQITVPNSLTFQPAWAKPLPSSSLGCGTVFNLRNQNGHADSFIACRCGQISTKKQSYEHNK